MKNRGKLVLYVRLTNTDVISSQTREKSKVMGLKDTLLGGEVQRLKGKAV